MRAKNLIPEDSIIVPGFCGDLLGGSYIPVEMKENKSKSLLKQELQEYILWRHLGNSSVEISMKIKDDIKLKIKKLLIQSKVNNIDDFVSYNEDFFTKHKVSKFVVNAVRMYDYFGYEWRLPLWDKELIEYWYKVPNNLRINSYLYDKFLLEILFKELSVDYRKKETLSKNKKILAIRKVLPLQVLRIIKQIIMKISKKEDVNNFSALETYLIKDLTQVNPKDFNSLWIIKKSMILKVWNFIISRFYLNETIVLYKLKNYQSQTSVATIKHATNENLKDVLYFQHERYINIFKTFLSLEDKGYFAYLKDKCIHRSWLKGNQQVVHPHWAYPYKLKENEIFIHYCETAPEARGKNIYPHVLSNIIEEHQDKEILISVNDENIASKKGVEKVGFRERERVKVIIILGMKFIKKITKENSK